jgi:Ca-activated chloride channel homolog
MRKFYRQSFGLTFAAVCLLAGSEIFAQESTSSASVARSRALAATSSASPNSYRKAETFVAPDEVRVEEFVNYHRHRLPLPKAGRAVALDVRWGSDKVSNTNREAVLQIGLTTAFANERTDLRPLNLALVIDKSGSMAAEDKMSRVRASLRKMIEQLRPDDFVSIVVFDSEARVLCPSMRVGNGYALKNAIERIEPGDSTNLHAGLMLGYREARKNFAAGATNRVILLTDGIANTGVTDSRRIAAESSEFNGQGIDLSTIGVGIELDRELLRTLSKQGRGLFHFVSDAHDIEKVFVTEVQSLISSVARKVTLEIEFDPGLEVERIYGYEPEFGRNRIEIPLDDMNSGLTQVVMLKFRLKNSGNAGKSFPVKANLSFFDIKTRARKTIAETAPLYFERSGANELLVDAEVRKNYTIAELAQSLDEMRTAASEKDYRRAENLLNASVATAYERYPNMEDGDIKFILGIVEDYQTNLRRINRTDVRQDDCGQCR